MASLSRCGRSARSAAPMLGHRWLGCLPLSTRHWRVGYRSRWCLRSSDTSAALSSWSPLRANRGYGVRRETQLITLWRALPARPQFPTQGLQSAYRTQAFFAPSRPARRHGQRRQLCGFPFWRAIESTLLCTRCRSRARPHAEQSAALLRAARSPSIRRRYRRRQALQNCRYRS